MITYPNKKNRVIIMKIPPITPPLHGTDALKTIKDEKKHKKHFSKYFFFIMDTTVKERKNITT